MRKRMEGELKKSFLQNQVNNDLKLKDGKFLT